MVEGAQIVGFAIGIVVILLAATLLAIKWRMCDRCCCCGSGSFTYETEDETETVEEREIQNVV